MYSVNFRFTNQAIHIGSDFIFIDEHGNRLLISPTIRRGAVKKLWTLMEVELEEWDIDGDPWYKFVNGAVIQVLPSDKPRGTLYGKGMAVEDF